MVRLKQPSLFFYPLSESDSILFIFTCWLIAPSLPLSSLFSLDTGNFYTIQPVGYVFPIQRTDTEARYRATFTYPRYESESRPEPETVVE